jgi:hypothetical protein
MNCGTATSLVPKPLCGAVYLWMFYRDLCRGCSTLAQSKPVCMSWLHLCVFGGTHLWLRQVTCPEPVCGAVKVWVFVTVLLL